ncbi:MAG: DNA repair protein RecO [Candidatus Omnitrophota bacterium]
MAIQKTEGILLRRQDLRETSLILTFYTREFGKIKGIVRGVRGPRSACGGGNMEIFALDEVVFYERRRADIFTISQCDLVEFFAPVRESLDKLAYATYLIELIDSVTALGDKNVEAFELLLNSLKLLAGDCSTKRVARIFEIKLLHLLGLMPTLGECVSCAGTVDAGSRFSFRHGGLICKKCFPSDREARPILQGTVNFIEHIRSLSFERVSRVKVAAEVGHELERILRKFLDFHIERRLKTVQFLKVIEK